VNSLLTAYSLKVSCVILSTIGQKACYQFYNANSRLYLPTFSGPLLCCPDYRYISLFNTRLAIMRIGIPRVYPWYAPGWYVVRGPNSRLRTPPPSFGRIRRRLLAESAPGCWQNPPPSLGRIHRRLLVECAPVSWQNFRPRLLAESATVSWQNPHPSFNSIRRSLLAESFDSDQTRETFQSRHMHFFPCNKGGGEPRPS